VKREINVQRKTRGVKEMIMAKKIQLKTKGKPEYKEQEKDRVR